MEIYCTRPGCPRPRNFFPDLDDSTKLKTVSQKFCTACGMPLILDNRYFTTRLLGQGGFGAAFLARDRRTPNMRYCVVKQFQLTENLSPDQLEIAQRLFEREAEVLEDIGNRHPQIPDLLAFFPLEVPGQIPGQTGQFFYIVQEFVDGQDMEGELATRGKFSEAEILEILTEMLNILKFVHENGSIHRDIKPSNIMRRRDGRLYLLDFGAVKQVIAGAAIHQPGKASTVIYSMGFAPPEQMRGDKVYPATDLYALAVTCITLLTGKPPNELHDIYSETWNWRIYTQVSDRLEVALNRMLLPIPSQRFRSAEEVIAFLKVPPTLQSVLNGIEAGHQLTQPEIDTLMAAVRSEQATITVGDRAVTIGVTASGRNLILTESDAKAISELTNKRSPTEIKLLASIQSEVDSRLRQSLLNGKLIDIGIDLRSEQVIASKDLKLQFSNEFSTPFPESTSVLEVFDYPEISGNLLILGAPGSGKTTVLLDLARSLIVRAQHQSSYPIPVLFNLRSWREAGLLSKNFPLFSLPFSRSGYSTIDEWLIAELKSKYGVRTDVGKKWLEEGKLLPILDGLDEVPENKLEACIKSINKFLREKRPLHFVVCSRIDTYSSSSTRLLLNDAICLKPLSQDQVLDYFNSQSYPELQQVVRNEPKFLRAIQTPLLLKSITLACQRGLTQELLEPKFLEILKEFDPSQVKFIEEIVIRVQQLHKKGICYCLRLTALSKSMSIGESITVDLELLSCTDVGNDDDIYKLEILESEAFESELNIFLSTSGFQFDSSNVASLPFCYSKILQSAQFTITALRSGSNLVRAEVYCGETFKTTLEVHVQVLPIKQPTSYSTIEARSRPVPQPDLTLRIQTLWNDRSPLVSFQYHLDSFHPSLRFASGIQQASTPLPIESLEQTRDLLKSTLENSADGLPEDFHTQLASLGQYLFQRFLPPELQQTFRTLMRFNQTFTLLILADQDAGLPWELLHDGQQFLGERLIIGRWPWELDQTRPYEFAIGSVNVAHYANLEQPELWTSLLEVSGAPPPTPLGGGMLADLSTVEAMRGLHLVRLGLSPDAVDRQDAPVLFTGSGEGELEQELQPIKLNLRRNRPLVSLGYLNEGLPELTMLEQAWAATFIRSGCSAFVGPLWAVAPTVEAAFVSNFYHRLWAGDSLGMAFQAARRTAQAVAPDSLDWMAYFLFGDPMARPYRPSQGKGYAVVEPIGQEITDPVAPGASVRFRASLRRTPPVWYDNRLMDVAEDLAFNDLQVYVIASGLQVVPADAIEMQRTPIGDYVGWFTLTVPVDRLEPLALVQVHFEDEMEPIHSLRFSLIIGDQEEQA